MLDTIGTSQLVQPPFNSLSAANYFNVFCHVTLKNHISGVIYSSICSYTSLERENNTLSKTKISVVGNP